LDNIQTLFLLKISTFLKDDFLRFSSYSIKKVQRIEAVGRRFT